MATLSSIFIPNGDTSATLATVTSTAELTIGKNQIFALTATGDIHIKFGNTSMSAAAATNFLIPSGGVATYDMGSQYSRIRLFNPGGSTITYFIQYLSRS